jgi:hypothetical protein
VPGLEPGFADPAADGAPGEIPEPADPPAAKAPADDVAVEDDSSRLRGKLAPREAGADAKDERAEAKGIKGELRGRLRPKE